MRRTRLNGSIATAMISFLGFAQTLASDTALSMAENPAAIPFAEAIEAKREDLISFRRDLHRHPEPSNEEKRTAGKAAERLKALGFEVEENIAGYGIVALLKGSGSGPLVAFRADMDAVRTFAPDPVEFRSTRPGVRHICGHDIHTTIGVALAEGFAASRDAWPGSVMLIFQPAEETANGARDMLAAGIFEEIRPDAIFAYHTAPPEVGTLMTAEGRFMAARDRVEITVRGGDQNLAVANRLYEALAGLTTVASPLAPQSAQSDFVFADAGRPGDNDAGAVVISAHLSLATEAASSAARADVQRMVEDATTAHPGTVIDYIYKPNDLPGVVNNAALTRRAVNVARSVLGQEAVVYTDTLLPAFSEDYGHFLNQTPGMMFFLGVSNQEKGWNGFPHAPNYVADEESIFIGAKTMGSIMLDYLSAE